MRRSISALACAGVLVSSCGPTAAPTTTTTTTRAPSTTTTTAPPQTTTTTPLRRVTVTASIDMPAALIGGLTTLLSEAVDGRNPPSDADPALRTHLAGAALADVVDISSFSSGLLADGTAVGVARTVDGDVILGADEGNGWAVVGVDLSSVGLDPWYGEEPQMVLVIGSDARPGQDPMRFRADSLHVITARPSDRAGTILGWPRDSYVETPYGSMKITALMVNRGPGVMLDQFIDYWDLPVEGYIVTGFRGFEQLVGEIGSIFIDIPKSLPTQPWYAGFSAGEQWLDPVRALDYSRTRKGVPGGDLTRSRNQGVLMLAALRMVQMYTLDEVPRLLAALTEHADTDLTATELIRLGATAMTIDPDSIANEVLPGTLGRAANNASVVFLEAEADDLVADVRDDGLLGDG